MIVVRDRPFHNYFAIFHVYKKKQKTIQLNKFLKTFTLNSFHSYSNEIFVNVIDNIIIFLLFDGFENFILIRLSSFDLYTLFLF